MFCSGLFWDVTGEGLLVLLYPDNGPVLLLFERLLISVGDQRIAFKYTAQFKQSVFSRSGHGGFQGCF